VKITSLLKVHFSEAISGQQTYTATSALSGFKPLKQVVWKTIARLLLHYRRSGNHRKLSQVNPTLALRTAICNERWNEAWVQL